MANILNGIVKSVTFDCGSPEFKEINLKNLYKEQNRVFVFYLKRGNKYYFRELFGAKLIVESEKPLDFKKGQKYIENS